MPKDYQDVEVAEERTPLAEFQKARTDAMSRMFDRDPMCGEIHTTSQLYADLDQAFTKILTTYGNARELQGVEKVEKRLPTVEQVMIPSLMAGRFEFERVYFLTGKDEYRKATLDHIAKIKTELSAKQ